LYPNLLGQKAYRHMTNEDMAKVIGVSRTAYEQKIRSGRFTPSECRAYCELFRKSFEFLFSEEDDPTNEQTT